MALTPSTRLGPYEITAQIGVGGMGEVYRATDTTLNRQVAVKVLPESLASDAERIARFEREAKTLASLNHTNIAQIYGFEKSSGVHALVMELVEGPTLADRIAQGAIPVDEALPIAKQIAEALEAAHEQGIIHRDLKPANVKVRSDGTVKVLDFGLAKALEPSSAMSPGMSQAPTITTPAMTQAGMILGTAAYMSPEQARGKTVDKRTDIWAFGCVLYEVVTGQRAFQGDGVSDTLAKVIEREPDFSALPPSTPPALRKVLVRCLEKPLKRRLRDIGDALVELDDAAQPAVVGSPAAVPVTRQLPFWRPAMPLVATLVVGAAVATIAVWMLMRPDPPTVTRFQVTLAADEAFSNLTGRVVAISPDSTQVVYSADGALSLRSLDRLQATPIPGTEGATSSFFSSDGQWVGFWAEGQLKRVSVSGGTPLTIGDVNNLIGVSWGSDDMILYGQGAQGIWRVPGTGGTPEQVIPVEDGEEAHGPQLLPGGEWVLFTFRPAGVAWDQSQIVVQSITTGERTMLIDGGRDARYLSTGHLVYGLNNVLLAVPFDVATRQVTGGPVPLVADVQNAGGGVSGAVQFSVSSTGSLVYVTTEGLANLTGVGLLTASRTLAWVDRQGREEQLGAPVRAYSYPRLSPDGTQVAVDIRDEELDIWVWNIVRETLTRLTFDPGFERFPTWSPDGRRIAFSSQREGTEGDLFWQAADGTGPVERLARSERQVFPTSFSPDATRIVALDAEESGGRVTSGLQPLLQTTFGELNGEISPDGEWIAYQSNESGQYEVYVRPFPGVDGGRWQVSTDGGTQPLWARSGRELFYRSGAAMMAVAVETSPSFAPGSAELLFQARDALSLGGRAYDVSPDGERFLILKEDASPQDTPTEPYFIVVQNWFEELRRLVPTN